MKYRRRIFPAMAALLLALSLCPCSALAAGDGAAENMQTATAPAQAEPPALYPTEVLEYTAGDLDEPRISKTYELSPTDDPALIPTGDFERSGRVYTLLDIIKEDQTETDTKEHIEVITLETDTSDMAEILQLLEGVEGGALVLGEVVGEAGAHEVLLEDVAVVLDDGVHEPLRLGGRLGGHAGRDAEGGPLVVAVLVGEGGYPLPAGGEQVGVAQLAAVAGEGDAGVVGQLVLGAAVHGQGEVVGRAGRALVLLPGEGGVVCDGRVHNRLPQTPKGAYRAGGKPPFRGVGGV